MGPEAQDNGERERVVRDARATVSLEVAFQTEGDIVRAYTQDLGVGGISILTTEALPRGTEVTLQLRVPGWSFPVRVGGKVVWSRSDAMGIAFKDIRPDDYDRIRKLVLDYTSPIDRARSRLGYRDEEPVTATVTSRKTALVQLSDEKFTDVVADLLSLSGVVAVSDWISGSRPNVIVAERATACSVPATFHTVPVVMANTSGPNELLGSRAALLHAVAFVPRPASAVKIVEAVKDVFRTP